MRFYEEEWRRLAARMDLSAFPMQFIPEDPSEEDHYTIVSGPEKARITASNERSFLMGVYRFFYELGVRYLGPGPDHEWFPLPGKVEIPGVRQKAPKEIEEQKLCYDPRALVMHVDIKPGYHHRGICIEGADSAENILDVIDWLPKIGMNSFFVQFRTPETFLNRWYSHIGNPKLPREEFDAEAVLRKIDQEMGKRGLLQHRVGHGWTGAVLGTQAEGWDREKDSLSPEAEAMTALVNGKRGLFGGIPLNTNLCMSDPKVRDRFAQEVVTYAKTHPEVRYLHIWLADDCNNHCECEACRKARPVDHYVKMLNEVDQRLTEAGLDTKLVFLLYLELLWAPEIRFRNPDRFVMMFAPISRSFESGYRQVTHIPEVPAFKLNHIQLPVKVEENIAFLKEWQKVFSGDAFVYDYHLGRAHYGDPGYTAISRQINEDVYALKSLGLNGMIACQELRAGFPNFLPDYVMGMTLTQPPFSFADLEDEYFSAAYGEHAEQVTLYLEKLSQLTSMDWFNGKGPRVREDLVPRYEEALALVRKEAPAIRDMHSEHPVTEKFLNRLRYHSEYCERYLEACLAALKGEDPTQASDGLKQLIRDNEPRFQGCLDVYRLQEIMRNYTKI